MKKFVWLGCCITLLSAAPVSAGAWTCDLTLYAWLCGLEGEMGIADVGEVPVSASFDDLLGYVDFAMAGHFEAKTTRGLVVTDISYIGLSAERDASVLGQPVTIDMDLDQWIIEAGGGYRATPEFDVLLVARFYLVDLGGTVTSGGGPSMPRETTQDWGDVFVGARYQKNLNEKWLLSLRGDVAIFGSYVGGSDSAWFGNALIAYTFSDRVSAGLAWRVLSLDYEGGDDATLLYDITQDGLGVGVGFSF